MRLFVGIWPPPAVVRRLGALRRPDVPGVRWIPPEQWHVTLAFLGAVPSARVGDLLGALSQAAAGCEPVEAVLGPSLGLLGRGVLSVPVGGVDGLASAVTTALRRLPLDLPDEDRSFRGHLTLARGRGRRRVPVTLAGTAVSATWPVAEIVLASSIHDPPGVRYETVGTARLEDRGRGTG